MGIFGSWELPREEAIVKLKEYADPEAWKSAKFLVIPEKARFFEID